ncbi:tripartite tricarboxylate transporter substrate binding protein [Photobacterium rosenbergii]|uniref:Tripartite tricarboxylate transporter substrate binding protein n=1 Tax=Photobacterium rosenbergii TaxID=294936 RepID=A0ABU3ZB81_9GAMM|nr:tripartite tricarboxylate transporter substrate binding protein [Photobacterium rosenbergii]MDV5167376.1 tripartite tricarboxylate transporter substrate binding protein [Photobacterium rosenbergii]
MKKLITAVMMSAVFAATSISTATAANNYPDGPVKIIVPYSAGGGSDSVSRALAEALKPDFPKGIAVENRTGGAGSIGMSYGMNSKADGTIVTMIAPELVMLPHTGNGGDIDYKKFKPLAMVNSGYAAITVPSDSPYKNLDQLIEGAKTNNLLFGNSGTGSIWHLAGAGMEQAAGVEFTHVPFQGSSAAITSLLGHHLDGVSVSYAEVASHVEAGTLRALAVLAPNRLKDNPDVPTAKELGYDVVIGTWRGYAVPANTPEETVDFLTKSILNAAETETFVKFMNNTNNDIEVIGTEKFAQKIANEDNFYKQLIESIGLNK